MASSHSAGTDHRPISLSVIIPTLNAAHCLARTVDSLRSGRPTTAGTDLIVVDGASTDDTADIARASGARLVRSARGRGTQLRAGAGAAHGEWLLFLHADTRLEPGWGDAVIAFTACERNRERAGYFGFALDDDSARARRLERLVGWRCRKFGLPYGDQGLVIRRDFYFRLGGHPELPLMEDVALVRRIGRTRLTMLRSRAVTSAARYRRDGYLRRSGRNLFCLLLYGLGVPPRWIARVYG